VRRRLRPTQQTDGKDWVRWCWENDRKQLVTMLNHESREHTRLFGMGQQSEEKVNAADWPSYRQQAEAERLLAAVIARLEYPNGE
jgi:hypothetical protein